jgi:hypothetical protein
MNNLHFELMTDATEVIRISKDGVWVNPAISINDASRAVLAAIDTHIRVLVEKTTKVEREMVLSLLDALTEILGWQTMAPDDVVAAARAAIAKARGEK